MLFVLEFIFILDQCIPISELRLNLTLYLFFLTYNYAQVLHKPFCQRRGSGRKNLVCHCLTRRFRRWLALCDSAQVLSSPDRYRDNYNMTVFMSKQAVRRNLLQTYPQVKGQEYGDSPQGSLHLLSFEEHSGR